MFRTLPIALATVLATACATFDDRAGGSDPGGGKTDDAGARITFAGDFTETVVGRLVAGGSVRVAYDLDRLRDCRGSTGGSEVWGVSGFVAYDDAAPETFAVSELRDGRVEPVEARLDIPAGTAEIRMWFAINNRWGCVAYDSNFGDDYRFAVAPSGGDAVVLDFADDYSFTATGPVRAGDRVVIHYEPSRLAECAGSSGGHAQWAITGYWSIDGAAARSVMVTVADGPELVAADPAISIPEGRDLALWFEATDRWGCHAIDSDFGANYHVAIE
jgi:hypothetical protein